MKELYISPELEILSFAPMQKLAGPYGNSYNTYGTNSNINSGLDSTPEVEGDYNETVTPGDGPL